MKKVIKYLFLCLIGSKIHVKVTKILRICRKKFFEYPPWIKSKICSYHWECEELVSLRLGSTTGRCRCRCRWPWPWPSRGSCSPSRYRLRSWRWKKEITLKTNTSINIPVSKHRITLKQDFTHFDDPFFTKIQP